MTTPDKPLTKTQKQVLVELCQLLENGKLKSLNTKGGGKNVWAYLVCLDEAGNSTCKEISLPIFSILVGKNLVKQVGYIRVGFSSTHTYAITDLGMQTAKDLIATPK